MTYLRRSAVSALTTTLSLLALTAAASPPAGVDIIPAPETVTFGSGTFTLTPASRIVVQSDVLQQAHAEVLSTEIFRLSGLQPATAVDAPPQPGDIVLTTNATFSAEAYRLVVGSTVAIEGKDHDALTRGTASLLHLIGPAGNTVLDAMTIEDEPDSAFRTFMADLGRNYHSIDALKQTIDMLRLYKVNYLHLHLTDDQRFSFPSTAFPELDDSNHGGQPAYPLADLHDLEAYAVARGVVIVPELEVPGHAGRLFAERPDAFGTGSADLVATPAHRNNVKILVDEIAAVFQATPYFHIGGDEVGGVSAYDQRDFLNEMDAHIKSHAKTTLAWEGVGLGTGANKVSTDVIYMNWNTVNFRADDMLAAGYSVINAAWDPMYLVDHYPRNNFTMASPRYIYNETDRYVFRHMDPGFSTFLNPVVVPGGSDVIGMAMPWWEGREENYMPLCHPRVAAMGARNWNFGGEDDYPNYAARYQQAQQLLQKISTPVAIEASGLVVPSAGVFHDASEVTLSASVPGTIRYTTNGSLPTSGSTAYTGSPIPLTGSTTIRAALFDGTTQVGHACLHRFRKETPTPNLALGKPVSASVGTGPIFHKDLLTDGGTGSLNFFLAYPSMPSPAEIVVDLQVTTGVNRIKVFTHYSGSSYESYTVALSTDGSSYTQVADNTSPPAATSSGYTHDFSHRTARYVRIRSNGHKNKVFSSFSKITEIQAFDTTAPSNPVPSDGAAGVPRYQEMSWDSVPTATGYEVRIWEPGDPKPASPEATVAGTSYQPAPPLDADTDYRWEVTALLSGPDHPGPAWSLATVTSGSALPPTVYDLADATLGGDGSLPGSAPNGEIVGFLSSGAFTSSGLPDVVDGVFAPGNSSATTISTTLMSYDFSAGVGSTGNNRGPGNGPAQGGFTDPSNQGNNPDFSGDPSNHSYLEMHANVGITYDLDEVRALHPGQRLLSFSSIPGIGTGRPASWWVLLDGVEAGSGAFSSVDSSPFDVPLDDEDHFVTLAMGDGGDTSINNSHTYMGDPFLHLEPGPPTTYTEWVTHGAFRRTTPSGEQDMGDDPNLDNTSNLMHYLFGTLPDAVNPGPPEPLEVLFVPDPGAPGQTIVAVRYTERRGTTDYRLLLQRNFDLPADPAAPWTDFDAADPAYEELSREPLPEDALVSVVTVAYRGDVDPLPPPESLRNFFRAAAEELP